MTRYSDSLFGLFIANCVIAINVESHWLYFGAGLAIICMLDISIRLYTRED